MTSAAPVRSAADVHRHVAAHCLRLGPPGTVGVEVEWHVVDLADPLHRAPLPRVGRAAAAAGPLPGGSLLTYEPGGQLELSSAPAPDLSSCVRRLDADVTAVRRALADDGLHLLGQGTDPLRPPERLLDLPRYTAMEQFFAPDGSAGATMMCSTAAVQVSLEAGCPGDGPESARFRWELLHRLGPVLVAAFAASPLLRGRATGWRSTRQALWSRIDPTRTRPAAGVDLVNAWTGYALRARVMLLQDGDGDGNDRTGRRCLPVPAGTTFGDWVAGRTCLRLPTESDLAYHLTTLFPPVRLRGWLEVRVLDALPDPWWQVAAAVVTALLDDPGAATAALTAAAPAAGRWELAARDAMADPVLQTAAARCFDLALEALPRLGAAELVPLVAAYADAYVTRGRCPADDLLDLAREGGALAALLPPPVLSVSRGAYP